jgi:hypothetical protein
MAFGFSGTGLPAARISVGKARRLVTSKKMTSY